MQLVLLTTLYKQPIAHMLKAFMKSRSIDVFIFNEAFSVLEGGVGFAGIQVKVKKEQLLTAQKLLEEFNIGESL